MVHVEIGIHIFQPDSLHSFPQWGVLSGPVLPLPGLLVRYPQRHPLVETPQNTPYSQGRNPVLCSEEQDVRKYVKVKTPQHHSFRALPPQYPQQSVPDLPRLLYIYYYLRTVIVCHCEEAPQVF